MSREIRRREILRFAQDDNEGDQDDNGGDQDDTGRAPRMKLVDQGIGNE